MKKDVHCDLYSQSEEVIKTYEDLAFMELINLGKLDCCNEGHPRFGRHAKLFIRTACNIYERDKRRKEDCKNRKRRRIR